jgi:hypothetical protein
MVEPSQNVHACHEVTTQSTGQTSTLQTSKLSVAPQAAPVPCGCVMIVLMRRLSPPSHECVQACQLLHALKTQLIGWSVGARVVWASADVAQMNNTMSRAWKATWPSDPRDLIGCRALVHGAAGACSHLCSGVEREHTTRTRARASCWKRSRADPDTNDGAMAPIIPRT